MRSTGAISSDQLSELEADIRAELGRIERTIAREAEEVTIASADGTALRNAPATGADGELTVTLTGRVHARQMELAQALRRIEDGRYGVCGSCGTGIPYGRLLAVPEATHCLACRS